MVKKNSKIFVKKTSLEDNNGFGYEKILSETFEFLQFSRKQHFYFLARCVM